MRITSVTPTFIETTHEVLTKQSQDKTSVGLRINNRSCRICNH